MHWTTVFSLLPLASATPLLLQQRQTPAITLLGATLSGPGCPSGSTTVFVDPSGNELTVGFDDYVVEIGPNSPGDLRERPCDIVVRASVPLGCTAAGFETTYHGFAQLDVGATGTFAASYSVSPGSITSGGNPANAVVSSTGFGGAGSTYTKTDPVGLRFNANAANQQQVDFVVRSRIFLQGNQGLFGVLTADDAVVRVTSAASC